MNEQEDKSIPANLPKLEKRKPQEVICVPQELVHTSNTLSGVSSRLWYWFLGHALEFLRHGINEPDEKGFYRIPYIEVHELLGYDPKKNDMRRNLETMRREPVIFNFLRKDGQKAQRGSGYISEWELGGGTIGFKLPTFAIDALQRLVKNDTEDENVKMFLSLCRDVLQANSGKYEWYLYKLCRDYAGIGRTPYMEIGFFRSYMGVLDSEYRDTTDFKRWVIDKPAATINKKSKDNIFDIEIKPCIDRSKGRGQRVLGIYFEVKQKRQMVLPFDTPQSFIDPPRLPPSLVPSEAANSDLPENHPVFTMAAEPLPQDVRAKLANALSPEEIAVVLSRANDYREGKRAKGESVSNYAGMVVNLSKPESLAGLKAKASIETTKRRARQENATAKEEELKDSAARIRAVNEANKAMMEKFASLPDSEKKKWEEEIYSSLSGPDLSIWKKGETPGKNAIFRVKLAALLKKKGVTL